MDLVIRHVTERDLEAVHEILTSPHVVAGSLRVPFAPLQQTRERLTRYPGSTSWWRRPRGGWVFTDNAPAIRLYERAGFVIEGTTPRRGFGAGGWLDGRASDGPAARPLNRSRPPPPDPGGASH